MRNFCSGILVASWFLESLFLKNLFLAGKLVTGASALPPAEGAFKAVQFTVPRTMDIIFRMLWMILNAPP